MLLVVICNNALLVTGSDALVTHATLVRKQGSEGDVANEENGIRIGPRLGSFTERIHSDTKTEKSQGEDRHTQTGPNSTNDVWLCPALARSGSL